MIPHLVVLAAALSTLASVALGQRGRPEVGKPFPIQEFPRLDRPGLHSIADFRGKKLLLVQFASW